MRRGRFPGLTLAVVAAFAMPVCALDVPFLAGRVNDLAGMLSQEEKQALEAKLKDFEEKTTVQVAVLTIPSLEGESLEDYSMKVAQTWQLGQKGKDNGVLLLIAKNDRKMRIEVGYGLEKQLTDLRSGRILDDVIRPRFKAGEFGPGIAAGVDAVLGALQGQEVPAAPSQPSSDVRLAPWGFRLLFFGIYALVIGVFCILALFTSGSASWFLYFFLMPFHLTFPMVLHPLAGVGIWAAWALGFPLFKLWKKSPGGKAFTTRHPGLATFAASSGSSGGGWSSSGGGWSSGGGGGFSGGGGSFGGGGSSGGW